MATLKSLTASLLTAVATLAAFALSTPARADGPGGFAGSTRLNGVELNGVRLNGVNFNGFNWNGISLQGPTLNGPILQGPILQGPILQGPILQGPILQGPVFQGPTLGRVASAPRGALVSVTLPSGEVVPVR